QQFFVIALALIGVAAADVSHLQLGYNYNAATSSSSSLETAQLALPGGDSSSYQPEHLIPQHLKASHVESASMKVVPGGDSNSYQPAHLIPQQLQVKTVSAEVVPGGDSSSYQPAHLIEQQSFNIGADTHTPEQLIPEADRIAHAQYVQEQEQSQAQVLVPGGDSSSYQPADLIPQHLKAFHASISLGADTQTPEQFIPEADRVAHLGAEQQEQVAPVVIGANTITPSHLYQEPVSNGIEEYSAERHVPAVIGANTITPAHLLSSYSAGSSSSASVSTGVAHDTQYGSNGGYVY
ncbi:hypothetical protein KR093_009653, partial [Drosophila rubida]